VEELFYAHQTQVTETTLRRTTYRHGAAAEAANKLAVAQLEREAPPSEARPEKVLLSMDGAFIPLLGGQWREVKTVVVGEVETEWNEQSWQPQVHTRNLSYFSRSYPIRDFERYAWAELHRRGVENARVVLGVNDGAAANQSFLDYHAPARVRIIDFGHTASYVAAAGKAIWGEETACFEQWYRGACHRLKHKPPQETVANLRLLRPKAKTEAQTDALERALFYIESRLEMMDYPYFQRRGYPIGSGCVESGHKVVVQSRLKGAGMRWAEAHVDPLLALRNLVCNGRWTEGWLQIVAHHRQESRAQQLALARAKQPPPPQPLTFAALKAAGLLPEAMPPQPAAPKAAQPHRPAQDHPWRKGIWPTKEAWRWN
jgi:hypothetical protein